MLSKINRELHLRTKGDFSFPPRITTFIIVFISIFCGWPCLLHFMAGFAKTGVVLSSVTGCLVFQSAVVLRALICLAVTGDRLQFSLHDLTEAVLVTASFHIRL